MILAEFRNGDSFLMMMGLSIGDGRMSTIGLAVLARIGAFLPVTDRPIQPCIYGRADAACRGDVVSSAGPKHEGWCRSHGQLRRYPNPPLYPRTCRSPVMHCP